MKSCLLCKQEKPLEDFHRHSSNISGRTSYCKPCMKSYKQQYETKNKEKITAYGLKYRQENKEKLREKFKQNYSKPEVRERHLARGQWWRESRQDAYKEGQRAWRENNPEKLAHYSAYHRALRKQAIPNWYSEFDDFVVKEAYRLSRLRAKFTGILWEVDHIIPIAGRTVCGLHVWNNFAVIPASENRSKFNRYE